MAPERFTQKNECPSLSVSKIAGQITPKTKPGTFPDEKIPGSLFAANR
jgi:hypothetical protein